MLHLLLSRRIASVILLFAAFCTAQNSTPVVSQQIDESKLAVLAGNTHPLALPKFDRGVAHGGLPLHRMLLILKRSPAQEDVLKKLLDVQQDKSSSLYHRWLTPNEFGSQFGPANQDVQTLTAWLQGHGFQIARMSRGRSILEFSGTAAQVEQAFHTSIHNYVIAGQAYTANASDPQIPSALVPLVAGIESLNNFPRKPMSVVFGTFEKSKATGRLKTIKTQFTFPGGCDQDNNCYAVGPNDFATIYNLLPLWNTGIDGTGESVAIVGQSNINIQDVRDFRSIFGLVANDPQIILNGPDPGPTMDETEADLDVEWSGAVAPKATVKFVVSQTTETTPGIDLSAEYVIDNNLAAVMSESYGECEFGLGMAGNQFYSSLWEQAAAQGITVLISSGDSGAAGCDPSAAFPPQPAQDGLAVNGIGSTPFNVSVGGTDFNDLLNPQVYWNVTNDPATQLSAKGYIPEIAWNDSCTNTAVLSGLGFSTNEEANCNDPRLVFQVLTVGGGGGNSNCTTSSGQLSSCSGGYSKPSWQVGAGVPADGKRDLPDLSLFAGDGFNGNFYVVCQSDATNSPGCDVNFPYFDFLAVGGTSASSPAFAGIMALVNQQTGSRQGLANYVLYKLAAQQAASNCNSSTGSGSDCIFNDVTTGTVAMPCAASSRNCTVNVVGDSYGLLSGYDTSVAYDAATGLGSVNAANLVGQWNTATFSPSTTTLILSPSSGITHGQPVNLTIGVTPTNGTGNPTGNVSLLTSTGQSVQSFALTNAMFSGSTSSLPGGSYTVTAHYSGDSTYGGSTSSPVSVSVAKENSKTSVGLVTFDSQGKVINPNATIAVYGSSYLLRSSVTNSAGAVCGPLGGCATGIVTLTDNGVPLDLGSYTLNDLGYFEDELIQLTGGINTLVAQYSGDNSFNPSLVTIPITITPAPTTFTNFTFPINPDVGQGFIINATVNASSTGVGPTGTFVFLIDGAPLAGTLTTSSFGGAPNNGEMAHIFLEYDSSIPSTGNHTITVKYSGDANYGPSSTSGTIRALYGTSVTATPSNITVQPGTTVTLSAFIDTYTTNLPPTGAVSFSGNPVPFSTSVAVTPTIDSSGHSAAQAMTTFVANANELIGVQYGGDANYFPAGSGTTVIVTGSDFVVFANPSSLSVASGASSSTTINIAGQASYTGTVIFSPANCSGLPAETTCSFGSSSFTGSGGVSLAISTTAPHSSRARTLAAHDRLLWVGPLLLAGVFLCSCARHNRSQTLRLVLLALLATTVSCGGGSTSTGVDHGPSDPGTPPGNYVVMITTTSGTLTHTVSLSLTVQ